MDGNHTYFEPSSGNQITLLFTNSVCFQNDFAARSQDVRLMRQPCVFAAGDYGPNNTAFTVSTLNQARSGDDHAIFCPVQLLPYYSNRIEPTLFVYRVVQNMAKTMKRIKD